MSGSPRGSIETSYQVAVGYAETSGPLVTSYVAVETLSGDERTIVRKSSRLKVISEHKVLTGPGLPSIVLDECSSVAVHAWTENGWHEVMTFTEQEPANSRGSHAASSGEGAAPGVEEAATAAHAFLNIFGEPLVRSRQVAPEQLEGPADAFGSAEAFGSAGISEFAVD